MGLPALPVQNASMEARRKSIVKIPVASAAFSGLLIP